MKNVIITSFLLFMSVSAFAETVKRVDKSEQANVIIYRTMDDSAVNYRLRVDGKHIGKLKANSAIRLQLSAGDHVITSNDRKKTLLKVSVGSDGVTYVRKDVGRNTRISLKETTPTIDVVEKYSAYNRVAHIK